jgi:HTH-type transcriptional regulator / antitoxin HigA
MEIRPIKTRSDYEAALNEIQRLWGAQEGSTESDRLDVLVTLVEAYEREHFPIDVPDPIDAIRFRLEQQGADVKVLVGIIGSRTRVYEILRRSRPLSLGMIRRLHDRLHIPAEVLIRPGRKGRSKRAA